MHLDRRLKEGLSGASVGIDASSLERDLHVVVQRGRRRRRNRCLVGIVATVALVIGAVVLAPRALDALRSVGEPRPAAPPRPEGIPGVITTVAGTGAAASRGDGGPAPAAAVRYPLDLVVDEAGNLYILEASGRIRKVDSAGRISTVAGPPATRAHRPH